MHSSIISLWGLSPLAQGNLLPLPAKQLLGGSIPARAGEPLRLRPLATLYRVYPRSRRGTNSDVSVLQNSRGLSPLAQGNRCCAGVNDNPAGSIPARAGEPSRLDTQTDRIGVYPRSRRGTPAAPCQSSLGWGLSPLAQGNHTHRRCVRQTLGSIPARAGEPAATDAATIDIRVYPRSRRGTTPLKNTPSSFRGLSPLAQGNRPAIRSEKKTVGSIPARAGEPPRPCSARPGWWVYPRSRRGTETNLDDTASYRGLSPLAQGNLSRQAMRQTLTGSIPARAGEPNPGHCHHCGHRVYPRSRRGTMTASMILLTSNGLSPLAQGNRLGNLHKQLRRGSIPARAGEPPTLPNPIRMVTVYPRSRRGTKESTGRWFRLDGLSPLAQGNPHASQSAGLCPGSIPARAGEPLSFIFTLL